MKRLLGILVLCLIALPSLAQDGQMKIMVGFGAGGVSDVLARIYAEEFKKRLNKTVIVENRAGGSGTIATAMVSRAEPDGNTLIMVPGTHTIIPALQKLDFDPKTALTPINLIASAPNLLIVRADAKYQDVKSLVEDAKANPGALAYGTSGVGTTVHFMAVILENAAGIKLNHIPYKSSGESVQAVVGGHIPMAFSALNSALPAIQSKQVRVLAIASEKRSGLLPDVPTFVEAGYKDVKSDTWLGLAGPANMPKDIVGKLNDAVMESLKTAEVKKRIADLGADPVGLGPDEFNKVILTELDKFERLARAAGLPKQ
jgi:tripartite-type tricarboxylate transporter receptor subunit TctC